MIDYDAYPQSDYDETVIASHHQPSCHIYEILHVVLLQCSVVISAKLRLNSNVSVVKKII